VSLGDFYFPKISPNISCSRIGRPILEIYKSLSDVVFCVMEGDRDNEEMEMTREIEIGRKM
jgi:hypothetical protein